MNSFSHLLGASLLIAGCCIGAGMLGLPIVTGAAGFIPSTVMFILTWSYMAITGLLLLEANLWTTSEGNLVSLAGKTLGFPGKAAAWGLFLFLFYSLMIAYISGSGALFSDFFQDVVHINVSTGVSSLILVLFFLLFLYFGANACDQINRILMTGLIASYVFLVFKSVGHIDYQRLEFYEWKKSFLVLPTMVVSFGFHNMIPSMKTYLKANPKALRLSIIIGSLIPLIVYLIWEAVMLGLISNVELLKQALNSGEIATKVLRQAVGTSWIVTISETFAFFAIVTSFLSVSLSFVDFLADGLKVEKNRLGKAFLCLLTVGPPFLFSLYYKNVFVAALNAAGAYGAVMLFGLMPALIVWVGRYRQNRISLYQVKGGKITLIAVMFFSVFVFLMEVL